ncbi:hypothetical protein [Pseudonocardia sp. T1-2H]|uniref:hypothetical protein n=1 Tax=Pseudonocardia sp. T1-2H TaxID=3128899 RepID=UPI0031014B89
MAQQGGRRLSTVKGSGERMPDEVERVTVSLIPKASKILNELHAETKMSKTDITNRALILYGFITEQLEAGAELRLHNPETGQSAPVVLL